MTIFFQAKRIKPGKAPKQYGHVVFTHAQYQAKGEESRPVVYKKNKYGKPGFSRFEAAFSELARLFLLTDLTAQQYLVKNNKNQVEGVACEHLSSVIDDRERVLPGSHTQAIPNYYQYKKDKYQPVIAPNAENIPFYFLNQFPAGFFRRLRQDEDQGRITMDMESLASVLTTSYTLEEDDLHKGNFGFYLVEKNHKPHAVFFKIDHDLMFADSIMSRSHTRFFNFFHGAGAFEITAQDLLNFPHLKDSQNYYWPTRKHEYLPSMRKAYTANDEVQAFADLRDSPLFNRLKWQEFYKHVLMPETLINNVLTKHLAKTNPQDRAQLALITQSVVARLAKLRAVLFSIGEFRDFVSSLNEAEHSALVKRIVGTTTSPMATEIFHTLQQQKQLCSQFVAGDTPLHAAIRLGDYRYHETWRSFEQFAEQPNAVHQTPLDVAVSMHLTSSPQTADPRTNLRSTIAHMVASGAEKTALYQQRYLPSYQVACDPHVNDYLHDAPCLVRVDGLTTIRQLKRVLRDVGEDNRYSLKMQKELSVLCVQRFINQYQDKHVHCVEDKLRLRNKLIALKQAINGTHHAPPAPGLQFIRQLRSELWIVRVIRGLLGGTATQVQLNKILNQTIKQLTPTQHATCCFFSKKRTIAQPQISAPPSALSPQLAR